MVSAVRGEVTKHPHKEKGGCGFTKDNNRQRRQHRQRLLDQHTIGSNSSMPTETKNSTAKAQRAAAGCHGRRGG